MNLKDILIHLLNEQQTYNESDLKKMYGWYPSFKNRTYKDVEAAQDDIRHVVDHNNKQFGKLFGNDNPSDIINLFNFVETDKGLIKIKPKVKQPRTKKPAPEYNTNQDLISKQKYLWSDTRGIEIGRYLSSVKYIDTLDSRIYGTETSREQNILNIMKKLKKGEDMPPILLDYDYGILDGHHRWEAAKRLNIKQIPVIIYENPSEEESLNEQQISTHNINDNFWKWFGNSKVVDNNGKPLIVYHGTKSSIFNIFKPSKSVGNQGEKDQIEGMYFTDSIDGASFFSLADNDDRFLKSVYLSIKNPYITPDYNSLKKDLGIEKLADVNKILIEKGYDGLMVDKGFYSNGGPHKLFMTFRPNQIKHIRNDGTWDASDNDIYS